MSRGALRGVLVLVFARALAACEGAGTGGADAAPDIQGPVVPEIQRPCGRCAAGETCYRTRAGVFRCGRQCGGSMGMDCDTTCCMPLTLASDGGVVSGTTLWQEESPDLTLLSGVCEMVLMDRNCRR